MEKFESALLNVFWSHLHLQLNYWALFLLPCFWPTTSVIGCFASKGTSSRNHKFPIRKSLNTYWYRNRSLSAGHDLNRQTRNGAVPQDFLVCTTAINTIFSQSGRCKLFDCICMVNIMSTSIVVCSFQNQAIVKENWLDLQLTKPVTQPLTLCSYTSCSIHQL